LLTDEATFTRDGIFNLRNVHIWAHANPHTIREARHQTSFSKNVWAGIVGDRLIWSSLFTRAVDGAYVPGIFGTADARHLA
jgi:hypothetical protein